MKQHRPSAEELTAEQTARPYFQPEGKNARCPYCNAGPRWHARLRLHRIEGSRATDKARRDLIDRLPGRDGEFTVVESKSDRQSMVYGWLESLVRQFDFSNDGWMMEATRLFLAKREPKTDWSEIFEKVRAVRRSQRLEEGWELDGDRLFLSHDLFDEVLLFQYVLSRSHFAGGRTFEGRLTIGELLRRLKRRHYFEEHEIERNADKDVLEQLVESLDPGSQTVRLYWIVDRREYLEKLKKLQ